MVDVDKIMKKLGWKKFVLDKGYNVFWKLNKIEVPDVLVREIMRETEKSICFTCIHKENVGKKFSELLKEKVKLNG